MPPRNVALVLFACSLACEPAVQGSASASAPASPGPVSVSAPASASAPVSASAPAPAPVSASAPAPASASARAPSELPGRTIDYPYDARDVKDPTRRYVGRAFVHDLALPSKEPLPLVVFLHGLNRDLIPHRWMGGGNEGDVRRIVASLIERGLVPPVVVAGPGSVAPAAVSYGASFPVFDLDRFIELTSSALAGTVRLDLARVVVTGHSGAGCSDKGGLVAAVRAKTRPLAVVSIDTCMPGPLAEALGGAHADTHVVVTWQTASWSRNFSHFRTIFEREATAHPAASGVLRELDPLPALPRAHDATVGQTFEKWLPRLLPVRR